MCSPSWLVLALCLLWGCALSVDPTGEGGDNLAVELAAFPDRLSVEDKDAAAEIWATVRQGGKPVKDSTLVFFAATIGEITASSPTRDGLAVAVLSGPADGRPRRGQVVAQARGKRDTIDVDFVLILESAP